MATRQFQSKVQAQICTWLAQGLVLSLVALLVLGGTHFALTVTVWFSGHHHVALVQDNGHTDVVFQHHHPAHTHLTHGNHHYDHASHAAVEHPHGDHVFHLNSSQFPVLSHTVSILNTSNGGLHTMLSWACSACESWYSIIPKLFSNIRPQPPPHQHPILNSVSGFTFIRLRL